MTTQEKFATTRAELSAGLIEREAEIDLCLTAMLARQHVLLVGLPGTAKSMLSSAITAWMDGQRFEILLTKFTTPEEVFGPVSLKGLKNDEYKRVTTSRLPEANIGFIDEIFKASSAILNTLLTILNEREFDNAGQRMKCPLALCVAASNEWPGENGQGKELGALFDRFLLRKQVQPIATAKGLDRLLWGDVSTTLTTRLSPAELEQAATEAAALPMPAETQAAFLEIYHAAKTEGIVPGDRRLRQAPGVIRAYAYLNGHDEVTKDDLEILSHILWDDPAEQPQELAKIVGKIANPQQMRINTLVMEAEEIIAGTNLLDLGETAIACKKLGEIHGKLSKLSGPRAEQSTDHVKAEIKRIRLATVEAI